MYCKQSFLTSYFIDECEHEKLLESWLIKINYCNWLKRFKHFYFIRRLFKNYLICWKILLNVKLTFVSVLVCFCSLFGTKRLSLLITRLHFFWFTIKNLIYCFPHPKCSIPKIIACLSLSFLLIYESVLTKEKQDGWEN